MATAPVCNVDLYDDSVLLDPYPAYRLLRDMGPLVYLERNGVHAMTRYAEVNQSLRNHDVFSSASGVSVSEKVNAVAKGTLISSDPPEHDLPQLFRDFIASALDTTIFATASLTYLLGTNPDQWRLLTDDPSLIRNTINEVVRLESPIRGFTRKLKADHSIGHVTLPEGTRVLLLYGSASRDERKWEDPERFDISRKVPDHLGFGIGVHSCAGMHLARLEIECIVAEMLKRVNEIHIDTPVWALNNNLRGIAAMPVAFRAR